MKKQYQNPRVVTSAIEYTDDLATLSVQINEGPKLTIDDDGDDPANGLAKGYSVWDEDVDE
jgi:hypothetical protein